tara:strand:+ start:30195 stop:32063 length:1869 start_codon:yes stop_codon:yes gene_type:complete
MSTQFIDYTKLGYRWKGVYSASSTYVNYDVVRKDGEVYYYYNGAWVEFAKGQQHATTKGQVVTTSLTGATTGAKNTYLHSNSNTVEFRFPGERPGTRAVKLMRKKHNGANYAHGYVQGAIMTDGSLRVWGDLRNGQAGLGNMGDISSMNPTRVALPGDRYIIDAFQMDNNIFVLDHEHQLWAMGSQSEWGGWSWKPDHGNGSNQAQTRFVNISEGTDMEGKKIVWFIADRDYNQGQGKTCMFAQDDEGGIYSWGFNQNNQCAREGQTSPLRKPEKITTLENGNPLPPIKYRGIFLHAGNYATTTVIDTSGKMYVTGYQSRNLFTTAKYYGFCEYTGVPGNTYSFMKTTGSDGHWAAGTQYYDTIVVGDTTGRLWGLGNSTGQISAFSSHPGWTPPILGGSSQMTSNDGQTIFGGAAAYGGNANGVNVGGIVDAYGLAGGYEAYACLTGEGSIWHVGYSVGGAYNGNSQYNATGTGTGGGWNRIRFRTEDGKDQTYKHIHPGNHYYEKSKFYSHHGRYGRCFASLTTDGYFFAWGYNNAGGSGVGQTGDIHPFNYQSDGIPSAQVNDKIIDYEVSGYISDATGNSNWLLLGENGDVYTVGWGSRQLNNNDDDISITTPKKVIF